MSPNKQFFDRKFANAAELLELLIVLVVVDFVSLIICPIECSLQKNALEQSNNNNHLSQLLASNTRNNFKQQQLPPLLVNTKTSQWPRTIQTTQINQQQSTTTTTTQSTASHANEHHHDTPISPLYRLALSQLIFYDFYHYNLSSFFVDSKHSMVGRGLADSLRPRIETEQLLDTGATSLSEARSPTNGSEIVGLINTSSMIETAFSDGGSSLGPNSASSTQASAPTTRPYWGDAFYSFQNVYWPIHCVICMVICIMGIFANVTNIIVLTSSKSTQRNWSVGLAKRAILGVFLLVPGFCIPNYMSFAIVTELDSSASNSSSTDNKSQIVLYKVGFSSLAEESKFIKTFHFWIFSCLTKLLPCVLLTCFTTVLINKLLEARERRLRLTNHTGNYAKKGSEVNFIATTQDEEKLVRQNSRKLYNNHNDIESNCIAHDNKNNTFEIINGGTMRTINNNEQAQLLSNNNSTPMMMSSNETSNPVVIAHEVDRPFSNCYDGDDKCNTRIGVTESSSNNNNDQSQRRQQQHDDRFLVSLARNQSPVSSCITDGDCQQTTCNISSSNYSGLNANSSNTSSSSCDANGATSERTAAQAANGDESSTNQQYQQQQQHGQTRILSQLIVESSTKNSANIGAVSTSMASTKMLASMCDNTTTPTDSAQSTSSEKHHQKSSPMQWTRSLQSTNDSEQWSSRACKLDETKLAHSLSSHNDRLKQQNPRDDVVVSAAGPVVSAPGSCRPNDGPYDKSADNVTAPEARSTTRVMSLTASTDDIDKDHRKRTSASTFGHSHTNRGLSTGSTNLAPTQMFKLQATQRQLSQNETTTRLLIAVIIVFLICEFPAGILAALCAILGQDFFDNVYQPIGSLTDLMALINSSVNFLLYCLMSQQFRSTFYQVVLRCPVQSNAGLPNR